MENYQPEKPKKNKSTSPMNKTSWIVLFIVILLIAGFVTFKPVYIMKGLGQQEMGVKIRAGEIVDIVGPGGIYSDFGLYVKMESYNIEGVWFQVSDDEVFTKDMQPVFVEIRGQVFRPSLTSVMDTKADGTVEYFSKDQIAKDFVNYRRIYTSNETLESQMDGFSRQAMKVCVGQNDLRGQCSCRRAGYITRLYRIRT